MSEKNEISKLSCDCSAWLEWITVVTENLSWCSSSLTTTYDLVLSIVVITAVYKVIAFLTQWADIISFCCLASKLSEKSAIQYSLNFSQICVQTSNLLQLNFGYESVMSHFQQLLDFVCCTLESPMYDFFSVLRGPLKIWKFTVCILIIKLCHLATDVLSDICTFITISQVTVQVLATNNLIWNQVCFVNQAVPSLLRLTTSQNSHDMSNSKLWSFWVIGTTYFGHKLANFDLPKFTPGFSFLNCFKALVTVSAL